MEESHDKKTLRQMRRNLIINTILILFSILVTILMVLYVFSGNFLNTATVEAENYSQNSMYVFSKTLPGLLLLPIMFILLFVSIRKLAKEYREYKETKKKTSTKNQPWGQLWNNHLRIGGAYETRTHDLFNAIEAL